MVLVAFADGDGPQKQLKKQITMQKNIVWDAHSCVPLSIKTNLECLREHHRAGVNVVSVNVGMDMNPLAQVIELLAVFRRQIEQSDFLVLAPRLADVDAAVADNKLAIRFDLEGANCCQGNPDMIYLLYELGVRQIHFAYNRNNALGGGCHDEPKGLTALGKRFVDAVNDCGMLMDVSHTGMQTSMDIFAYSDKPVFYSHANPYSLVAHARNISDEQIDACIATGGLVCVNGVGKFLGDTELRISSLVKHIDYLVERLGADKVGVGLDYCYDDVGDDDMPADFERDYWWPKSAGYGGGLPMNYMPPQTFAQLPDELRKIGYDEADIEKIMGANVYRLAAHIDKETQI